MTSKTQNRKEKAARTRSAQMTMRMAMKGATGSRSPMSGVKFYVAARAALMAVLETDGVPTARSALITFAVDNAEVIRAAAEKAVKARGHDTATAPQNGGRGLSEMFRAIREHKASGKSKKTNRKKAKVTSLNAAIALTPMSRVDVTTDAFLSSFEWRRLRMMALKQHGAKCQCCGATPATGAVMNVDHIKPRKRYPHLALELDNLQVLCHECNHGKGNWDQTDWRSR